MTCTASLAPREEREAVVLVRRDRTPGAYGSGRGRVPVAPATSAVDKWRDWMNRCKDRFVPESYHQIANPRGSAVRTRGIRALFASKG